MTADSRSYQEGFCAGWLAASQAILQTIASGQIAATPSPSLEMAGSLPARVAPRRGRPPKSLNMAPVAKRRRGRPRKTETA
jgi:hypothetical protein